MTDYPYRALCSHFFSVYEIPGSADHAGLLKVGDTSFTLPNRASELTVCDSAYTHPTMGKYYDKIHKVDCDRV